MSDTRGSSAGRMGRGPASTWGRRHERGVFRIRLVVAAWLVLLGATFCGLGHWWGLAYFPAAAAVVWFAYQLPRWRAARDSGRVSL